MESARYYASAADVIMVDVYPIGNHFLSTRAIARLSLHNTAKERLWLNQRHDESPVWMTPPITNDFVIAQECLPRVVGRHSVAVAVTIATGMLTTWLIEYGTLVGAQLDSICSLLVHRSSDRCRRMTESYSVVHDP